MIQTITSVADTDMHICAHINPAQLPTMLRDILSLAPSESEKDMLLMATLTACGSVMPNVYFRYGVAAKRYYPNLQVFIVGSAASGKGIANLALDIVKPIDECTPILIPGDATYAAFYQQLAKQHGHGYIHESEGSVITDVWRRQQAANYNTALRKAAEHEPISRTRCRETSVIEHPQVSALFTGTFGQYKVLVPSIENGYFSRLLAVVVDECQPFSGRYARPAEDAPVIMQTAAQQLYRLYEQLLFAKPVEFRLTDEQFTRMLHHFENAYPALIKMLGSNFHSVVLRMAIQVMRIAMILSLLRVSCARGVPKESSALAWGAFRDFYERETSSISPESDSGSLSLSGARDVRLEKLICTDDDYATAELIGNKLILHMAQAYQLIHGAEQVTLPAVKPLDQRQILLSLLPTEFESKQLVAEAQAQGISRATALRWNEEWQQQGHIQKIKYGVYKKIA